MKTLNATLGSFALASILAFSSAVHANPTNTANPFLREAATDDSSLQNLRLFDVSALPMRGERYLGSSRTATLYYKKGVKNFEKGNLEKADQHFRAVLRADGSRGLNKATLHYLANIKHQQGDKVAAEKYARAYFKIN